MSQVPKFRMLLIGVTADPQFGFLLCNKMYYWYTAYDHTTISYKIYIKWVLLHNPIKNTVLVSCNKGPFVNNP